LSTGGRVLIVFGLAGSGKSTLVARLALEFGLRKVHPSGVMRDLLAGRQVRPEASLANDGYWESAEGAQILDARLDHQEPVDLEADRILLSEVAKGEVAIDSWSLPWLTDKGLRIHLTAPLEVRSRRAAARGHLDLQTARERIAKKDEDTRQLFLRLYGFDIARPAPDLFDLTLDTATLSSEEVFFQARAFVADRWSAGKDFGGSEEDVLS